MKNLKSKIFVGALTLASFGAFGEKNLSAQNADSLSRDSIKIIFDCRDKNRACSFKVENHKLIPLYCEVPCFKDYKVPKNLLISMKNKKNNSDLVSINYLDFYLDMENAKGDNLIIWIENNVKNRIKETFVLNHNTGIIHYGLGIEKDEKIGISVDFNLTKQEIIDKYNKSFENRIKEIIDARKDSLKLTNLIKKEYEMGKLINENGEIKKIVHRFY